MAKRTCQFGLAEPSSWPWYASGASWPLSTGYSQLHAIVPYSSMLLNIPSLAKVSIPDPAEARADLSTVVDSPFDYCPLLGELGESQRTVKVAANTERSIAVACAVEQSLSNTADYDESRKQIKSIIKYLNNQADAAAIANFAANVVKGSSSGQRAGILRIARSAISDSQKAKAIEDDDEA